MNTARARIKGVICGVRVEEVEERLMLAVAVAVGVLVGLLLF